MLKTLIRFMLTKAFNIKITGQSHLIHFDERTLVVANHTSFIDAILIYAFLPVPLTFAINTYVANSRIGRIANRFSELFPLDPTNPLSLRALIKRLKQGGCVVIFPEGRITETGCLMKVYPGPGLVADRANATVLPIRIDGAQYSLFSKMRGQVPLRWFPQITLQIQAPRKLDIPDTIRGRKRREEAGRLLSILMSEMMYETANRRQTLIERLLEARQTYTGSHEVAEDINRKPLSYNKLLTRAEILGNKLNQQMADEKQVGVLLPNTLATIATFWGLQLYGKTPAMLNYTAGLQGLTSACITAQLNVVISSRQFIEKANLTAIVDSLSETTKVIYLEDIAKKITIIDKLKGLIKQRSDRALIATAPRDSQAPAVILFTSGSEGTPKGVVLSHENLLSNIHQLSARIDFNAQDIAFNALPLFHSFGLTAGMILPITSGIRTFFYPSPLHYRAVPELVYETNATMIFGTNTFLAGYGKHAHAYDFYRLRYVFAGAEKLQSDVRDLWQEKFGLRILEGYGATEASPVIAGNSPQANRAGTVGQLMPGIEHRLIEVPGLNVGQRLIIRGHNIMKGYLLQDNPGVLVPPTCELGEGWYDTGDIVTIDHDGFVTICGRAKRFAKIAGEMVSLTSVESFASQVWSNALHAALAIPDARKGEQIVLLTTVENARRIDLVTQAKKEGIAEISIPKKIISVSQIPVLGTGKIDYVSAQRLVSA